MSRLTVILCTHNPREKFIRETLGALRNQTLPIEDWDLLVIDNASQPPLATTLDLTWHPRARIVREEQLGIAHARLCALQEATKTGAPLILFVDDDNILSPDYLAEGLTIANGWPQLGCWGGQLLPRYEVPPPSWIDEYKKYLAIFPLKQPTWGNQRGSNDLLPPTAGTFIRRTVWLKFIELVQTNPLRLTLGPKGNIRIGGEDMDLMLTAFDLGLGLGRFPCLTLEHIMPAERLTAEYMTGLIKSINLGSVLLEYLRYGRVPLPVHASGLARIRYHWRSRRLPKPLCQFYRAEIEGRQQAATMVADWHRNNAQNRRP